MALEGPAKYLVRIRPPTCPLSLPRGQALAKEVVPPTSARWLQVLPLSELHETIPGLVSVDCAAHHSTSWATSCRRLLGPRASHPGHIAEVPAGKVSVKESLPCGPSRPVG